MCHMRKWLKFPRLCKLDMQRVYSSYVHWEIHSQGDHSPLVLSSSRQLCGQSEDILSSSNFYEVVNRTGD